MHPASRILDALFPRRCPVCGDIVEPGGRLICPACVKELSFVKSPTCKKCGKEVFDERIEYCFDCTRRRRSFEYGVALLNYNEAAAHSMAAVKYKNKREYLDFYGEEAVRRCGKRILSMAGKGDACLVPVPVHRLRRRARGFNQAELLAERLGAALSLPVRGDLLARVKNTDPQKELNPSERLRNLEAAFQVRPAAAVPSCAILVDDIYTTGSTMEACSRVLKRAGVEKVYFFVLCIGQGQ